MLKKLLFLYCGLILAYSLFSYSLTDPNLVLTSWPPYWQWQVWMWQNFFVNAPWLTSSFVILISALILGYLLIVHSFQRAKSTISSTPLFITLLIVSAPLLFSYNALSHDVFNYIFNAKMVAVYQANPHVQVALDYKSDDWVRFMHNTHTPAPYGYGWTILSLIPYSLGLGKFVPTWLLFRVMSLFSLVGLWWVIQKVAQWQKLPLSSANLALLFFNPLFLIEVLSNSHNDLWMMVPSILAIGWVGTQQRSIPAWMRMVVISAILLALSVSIKFASLALVPLWLGLILSQMISHHKMKPLLQLSQLSQIYWPLAASFLMFIPLLTERAQQFHPWYLIWVLVWLPLFHDGQSQLLNKLQSLWKVVVIALSFSSLYRYIPWLWVGNFDGDVLTQQKLITWAGGAIATVILLALVHLTNLTSKKVS